MKKILFTILGLFLFSSVAHAGLITVSTLSSDATIDMLNKNYSTIKNEINGSIESINLANDTLTEADFSDNINPRVRDGEFFNDYTFTGHLPATSVNLTSDISAGTSYVEGYRVVTSATSKIYTASKDTWVYIDINGTFQYEEVATDAAQPTTPSNSLLLAKVVTDTDNITSVVDYRTTSISITSPENFVIKGLNAISADETAISIDPGIVYVGTTRVAKTTITGLRTGTAADWHDGVVDAAATAWWYIGVKSNGDIKWLGTNVPDIHDTDENTDGTLYYWDDGTNHWRVVGVVRMNSGGWIDHMIQMGDTYYHGRPVSLTTTVSATTWVYLSCTNGIPPVAKEGIFGLYAKDDDVHAGTWIRPRGSNLVASQTSSNGVFSEVAGGTTSDCRIAGQRRCPTRVSSDTAQTIEYQNDTGDASTEITAEGFVVNLRD